MRFFKPISGHLSPDSEKWLYKSPIMNMLQLYFLTGILAFYGKLSLINNSFLVIFVIVAFWRKKISFSPLIILYGIITFLSTLNHVLMYFESGVINMAVQTMPVIFFLMLACRANTIRGLFERSVILNTIPIGILLIIGGIDFQYGRFLTDYLSEGLLGSVPQFAFAVGAAAFIEKRFNVGIITAIISYSLFMAVTSGRRYFLYLLLSIVVYFLSIKEKKSFIQTIWIGILICIIGYTIIPQMQSSFMRRYGEEYTFIEHIQSLIKGESDDVSSKQRKMFWEISLIAVKDNWLGYGNGNFEYVVRKYGTGMFSLAATASHPHAGFLDAIISAGYLGGVLYILILIYIGLMVRKDFCMSLVCLWMILQFFVETTFFSKIIWPLMAIAEREFEMNINREKESL